MKVFLMTLCASSAFAQIEQPKLGTMLTHSGEARVVSGIAGSVTIGDAVAAGVVSMGCSRAVCLFLTEPALISFDESGALVYFLETRMLARWQGGVYTPVEFAVTGEIIAIRSGLFAVRRQGGVWIVRNGDQIVQALPRSTRAVILLADGVLFTTANETILRRADGSELRFAIEPVRSFSWISDHYVQAIGRNASYAIRIDAGRERAFELPEVLANALPDGRLSGDREP
jgi:hypothetical protein